jgi:hypothetical protein
MRKVNILVAVLMVTALVSGNVFGGTQWLEKDGLEWQNPTNWSEGVPPGPGNEAYIGWSRSVNVNSTGNSLSRIVLGASNTGGNGLQIQSGNMTLSDRIDMQGHTGSDLLEVSGGTLTVANYVNIWNSNSIFRIVGSGGTLAGGAYVNAAGTVEFVVDGTGITQMSWGIGNVGGTGTISLISNGAAPGRYTLFTMATGVSTGLNFKADASFDITNINTWGHPDYGQAIVIPEPATIALMTLGLCGVIRRRYQK